LDKISEINFSYLDSIAKQRYYLVKLKENGITEKIRIQKYKKPLQKGNWNINIGAESFFFQEGEGAKYEAAKYG